MGLDLYFANWKGGLAKVMNFKRVKCKIYPSAIKHGWEIPELYKKKMSVGKSSVHEEFSRSHVWFRSQNGLAAGEPPIFTSQRTAVPGKRSYDAKLWIGRTYPAHSGLLTSRMVPCCDERTGKLFQELFRKGFADREVKTHWLRPGKTPQV